MSWLTKLNQRSGYCDFQMLPVDRYNFENRDRIRQQIRKSARTEAEKKAHDKGHDLAQWNNMDQTWCRNCGRRMLLVSKGSRENITATRKALTESCHESYQGDGYWQDIEDHLDMTRLDIN